MSFNIDLKMSLKLHKNRKSIMILFQLTTAELGITPKLNGTNNNHYIFFTGSVSKEFRHSTAILPLFHNDQGLNWNSNG